MAAAHARTKNIYLVMVYQVFIFDKIHPLLFIEPNCVFHQIYNVYMCEQLA